MSAKVFLVSRILLGLLFLVFGSNGLMMVLTGSGFIPMPPPNPEIMQQMGGFFSIKYLMPLVKGLQVIAALLLLSGFFVNLALVILAPILVNILCVHIFIDLSGLPIAIIFTVLYAIVLKSRWSDFKPLFRK